MPQPHHSLGIRVGRTSFKRRRSASGPRERDSTGFPRSLWGMRPPSCLDSDGSCDLRTASHLARVTRMLQDRLIGVAAHLAMLERAVLFFPHILILADVVLEAADIVQNLGTDPDKRRTGDSHASVAADSFDGPRFPPRALTSTTRKPCRPSATTISRSVVKSRTARPRRTSSAPSGSSAVMSDESMRR